MKIGAISGSLRQASYNSALLRALETLVPERVSFDYIDIEVPLYNQDIEETEAIQALEQNISDADAIVISTPEFNYGVPGVLKNAIDWSSRPAYNSVWKGKHVTVIGAAMSTVGTARAQAHLRQVMFGVGAQVFPHPEVLVGAAHKKFEQGKLVDERTVQYLTKYIGDFVSWVSGD